MTLLLPVLASASAYAIADVEPGEKSVGTAILRIGVRSAFAVFMAVSYRVYAPPLRSQARRNSRKIMSVLGRGLGYGTHGALASVLYFCWMLPRYSVTF